MSNVVCEHSVEVAVSCAFAWGWRIDVGNWDDPPARFQLDGPFVAGGWGTTLIPGQPPIRWQIRDVRPETAFVIDLPLDGAVLSFEWEFAALSDRRTRISQRVILSGDNSPQQIEQVRSGFASTLAGGMERIARSIEAAPRST